MIGLFLGDTDFPKIILKKIKKLKKKYFIIDLSKNNILKKDKLKEIANFSIQSFVRYLILYYIHTEVLHDKIHNNILDIANIIK